MKWINEPAKNGNIESIKSGSIEPKSGCFIRSCSKKGYCDGYQCIFLYCSTNS